MKIVETPCKRCNKFPRYDYSGYCMDCADELGLTEFALIEKMNDRGDITKEEYGKRLIEIMTREPALAGVENEQQGSSQ